MLTTLLAAALATPRTIDRHDWEQFLQPKPAAEALLGIWLGTPPKVEPETPALHYYLRDLAPYAGGVDLFLSGKDRTVESARFYLTFGPIYTDEHAALARKTHSTTSLADVLAWYGEPWKRTTSSRSGAARFIYQFEGDPKRELTFTAIPGSLELQAVNADRE